MREMRIASIDLGVSFTANTRMVVTIRKVGVAKI